MALDHLSATSPSIESFRGFLNNDNETGTKITSPSIKSFRGFLNNGSETETKTHRAVNKKQSTVSAVESSSDRLRQIELLERFLEQHDSCLAKLAIQNLQSDMDPFGISTQFITDVDQKKMPGYRILYQYLAYQNKKFGLHHIFLLLLLIGFTLVGGLIFDAIESSHEKQNLQRMVKMLMQRIDNASEEIISVVLSTNNQTIRQTEVALVMKQFYKGMLHMEGKLLNSALDMADNNRTMWNLESAMFYAMNLYTTIGYGTIVCTSSWGRAVTVIYSVIGIPLMIFLIKDLGRLLFVLLQKIYNRCYHMCWTLTRLCRNNEEDDKIKHSFPLRIAIPLLILYLLLCACVVHVFDYNLRGENEKGLNFVLSFYFTFISMTTIGLGDVMPINIQYSPFVLAMFMFGLVLFSVIINTIYARVEHNYFGAMEAMERALDKLRPHGNGNHGCHVFHAVNDVIRLGALIVLHISMESGKERHNLSTIPNYLDIVRKFGEFDESEATDIKCSTRMSQSDMDLMSINDRANNSDANMIEEIFYYF